MPVSFAHRLNEEQTDYCMNVLRLANRLRKEWSKRCMGKRKDKKFRNLLLTGSRNPNNCIPADQLAAWESDLEIIESVYKDKVELLGDRTVYEAVLAGYIRLAFKRAKQWGKRSDRAGISDEEDYEQDAKVALINAIFGYNDSVEFTTYLWITIRNHLFKVTNDTASRFGHIKEKDRVLLTQYDEAKRALNRATNFDEVADALGLGNDDRLALSQLLVKVYCESQVLQSEERGEVEVDYTSRRADIDRASQIRWVTDDMVEDAGGFGKQSADNSDNADLPELVFKVMSSESKQLLERANLSAFERKVFLTSLSPFQGWMTHLAKNNINPATNRPYSRMRITQVLRIVTEKLQRLCREAA